MPVDDKKPSIDKDGKPYYPKGSGPGEVWVDANGVKRDPLGASPFALASWTKKG
jgi:hypothetical protein